MMVENVDPLQKEIGDLVTWDMEKAEASMMFLPPFSLAGAPATLPKSEARKQKEELGERTFCSRR